jgi:hypothetical protein
MATFFEARQICLALKMQLSKYAWFGGTMVLPAKEDFLVVVQVHRIDDGIRKVIPVVKDGIEIRTDLLKGKR